MAPVTSKLLIIFGLKNTLSKCHLSRSEQVEQKYCIQQFNILCCNDRLASIKIVCLIWEEIDSCFEALMQFVLEMKFEVIN